MTAHAGRISRILFLTVLSASLLLSCSRAKSPSLTFAVGGAPSELDQWTKVVEEFSRSTGIDVKVIRQPTDTGQRRQGLLIPLKSGKPDPDVFLMDVAWISQFAASNWLEPLDDVLADLGKNVFFRRILDLADTYDGKILALPVYVDGGLLYYRKDLLSRFGYRHPPETWEELLEVSLRIQKAVRKKNPDFSAFVWQGAQYEGLVCTFLEFAGSNNGGIDLKKGRVVLATPENVRALAFMRDLIHRYRISPPSTFTEMKEEEVRLFFQSGASLFERNWPYAWSLHESPGSPVRGKVGIAPLPHFKGGKSVSTLGGWHLGISRFSDAKDTAKKFARYLLSYETQKKLVLSLGWNSGRKDIYEDRDVLSAFPHYAALRKVFTGALPRPTVPYYSQISAVVQKFVNAAIAGEMDPEDALREAEKECAKIVSRYEG